MDKISVIIPVYNAERYISKCILSIINQTYKNLEIIAVNDCSYDSSLLILNEYTQKEERLIIVNHGMNMGVEKARLTGLDRSTGTYIVFVDADDWLAPNALELMINKIQAENADMVTGSMVRAVDKYGFIRTAPMNNYTGKMLTESIEQPELFENNYISFFGVNILFVSVCCKLYRKEILMKTKLTPSGFRMGEDLIFSMLVHPHLDKIAFVDQPVYYYRVGGGTSKSNPTFLKDIKKQYRIKEDAIRRYNYYKALPYIKYELINCFYSFAQGLLVKDNFSKEELIRFVTEELKDKIYQEATTNIRFDERRTAVKERDVNKIVDMLYREKRKRKVLYRAKQIIFNLLN